MSGSHNRVAFRVDASLEIGSGHVVRCLTLARVLRGAGVHCHFICRDHPGSLISKVIAEGFPVHVLPCGPARMASNTFSYEDWLGVDAELDAAQTAQILEKISPQWLVVDHYGIGQSWHDATVGLYEELFVIDDLANRPLRADLLLNQNFGTSAEHYRSLVSDSCQLAIGTEYCLLRPEFSELRQQSVTNKASGELRRILVTMGGVDRGNATSQVLKALEQCALPSGVEVSVVLGSACPWVEQIETLASTLEIHTRVLIDVADMAGLMCRADFAIGAAGGTTWEFCSLCLPFAMLAIADNQISAVRNLSEANVALALESSEGLVQTMSDALGKAVQPALLRQLGRRAAGVTDGKGVFRIARMMGFAVYEAD